MYKRIVLIILDSVGLKAAPDAAAFGNEGASTLGHIYERTGLRLPNLEKLGLASLMGLASKPHQQGYYGQLFPHSVGKDTIAGHWEMMGVMIEQPLPVYPNGFPQRILAELTERTGYSFLGNKTASGTTIIQELGRLHEETGKAIIYTSADSVMQIAAHESIIPLEQLYEICETARMMMQGKDAVGRIIARPFIGEYPNYKRTEHRRDYALIPPRSTVLDALVDNEIPVYAVGKIEDVFAGRGISFTTHTGNNDSGMKQITSYMRQPDFSQGLLFANLNDFDSMYGHRRNVVGYAQALQEFDDYLPMILDSLGEDDLLIITADHGNDPTYAGTDHTREITPLLIYNNGRTGYLGDRAFSDIGATILANFGLQPWHGESMLGAISK